MHLGHILTARSVFEELGLDRLFMVAAAIPPHKEASGRLPGNLRYRMLDGALKNDEGIFPSDVELKREGKSYTVDTVEFFSRQYRGAELFLIVGGDMLENFPTWREPGRILSMAKLVAVTRPDEERDMLALAADIERDLHGKVLLSRFTGPLISSTEVRRRMEEAIPVSGMVAPHTELFMYENALYMPQELQELRARLSERIKRKRLSHTMLTALEAVKLADRYGADTQKARLAAMLHDCVKLPNKELVEYCDSNGYLISDEERENPYLIHSRLGAVIAREEFGVTDPEILQAIACHTLGRVGMSLMDKIIYVADKIEPSRHYEGLDEVRAAAYENLNRGMLMVMKHSVDYTVSSGRNVNPSTEAVMEYLEAELLSGREC